MLRLLISVSLSLVVLGGLAERDACGQCILANPSFELPGSGTVDGWNRFGATGTSGNASHGSVAARVSGPGTGGGDVSGYWQRLDAVPGERWSASVRVSHSSANPLSGGSRAILNIEWRDAAGSLIDFESHTAADAGAAPDTFLEFSVVSQPAPVGTAATHFLLGVLQSPTEPAPDVFYDQARFESLGPPTPEERQWFDFPGGRTLDFSGWIWRVKGPGYYGPGPNLFCDTASCTWVDAEDRLHLTVQNISGSWYSTEVTLEETLGYGDYIFTTVGRLDELDANVVFGLFLWEYGPCYDLANAWWNPYNEIDVEFSRWGSSGNDIGQFVAQPFDYPGNISRFDATFAAGELTSHAFRWLPDRVEYRSWRGGPEDETPANLIHTWTYTGPHIPRPERPRVHMNLWQFGAPLSAEQEVVIDAFTFIPAAGQIGVPEIAAQASAAATRLTFARPNPFNPSTTITYRLESDGFAEIVIYDVAGRLVRTLVESFLPAGTHEMVWDGRDDAGNGVASGVYPYRLRAGGAVDTKRMVLVR